MPRFCYGIFLFWFFGLAVALAKEPVQVIVEGIEGDPLANTKAALALPPDLVRNGHVDLLWLTRFERQIPEKPRKPQCHFAVWNATSLR